MPQLWFDDRCRFYGEVIFRDGTLERVAYGEAGKILAAHLIERWKTSGVEVMRTHGRNDGQTRELLFTKEAVRTEDPRFADAFRLWTDRHGHRLFEMPERLRSTWEEIASLPVDAATRFGLLVALKQAPMELLPEWRKAIEQAASV